MPKQERKTTLCVLMMLVLIAPCFALTRLEQDAAKKAGDLAMNSLKQKNITALVNVAVMPVWGDGDGFITEVLKSGITQTKLKLFVRSDKEWNTLLSEIEWNTLKEDVMDAKTIQKFGKIKGVDGLMYGTVWSVYNNLWDTRSEVKITLHLADVETGQVVWSSGPIMGEAFVRWSDALTRFWRYPLILIGVIAALFILFVLLIFIRKMTRHALRPR